MFTLLHKWFIDRSVRTGAAAPGWTRRAEARSRELRAFRARLSQLEADLRATTPPLRPSPRIRQAVLDAAQLAAIAAVTPRHSHKRRAFWLAAAAGAGLVATSAWVALRRPAPDVPDAPLVTNDGSPPSQPALPDTGIATVLSARRDFAAAGPLLEEARRLAADTRAVRDGLLARIPLIHEPAGVAGDLRAP